jgi:hypothetical protein
MRSARQKHVGVSELSFTLDLSFDENRYACLLNFCTTLRKA